MYFVFVAAYVASVLVVAAAARTNTLSHARTHTHTPTQIERQMRRYFALVTKRKTTKQRESNKSSVVSPGRGKLNLRGEERKREWEKQRESG